MIPSRILQISFLTSIALALSAQAITFTGTAIGSWTDPIRDPKQDKVFIINSDNSGGGLATFAWGTGSSGPNRLEFNGAGSLGGGAAWSSVNSAPFKIGDLSYLNNVTDASSTVDGVSLRVQLTITSPTGLGTSTQEVDFTLLERSNKPPNPADDLTFVTPNVVNLFTYQGSLYSLEFLGLSSNNGSSFYTTISNPEGNQINAGIYARINATQVDDSGSTLALLSAGGCFVWWRSRRTLAPGT